MKQYYICLFAILLNCNSTNSIAQQTAKYADHYVNNMLFVKMQDDSGFDVKDKLLFEHNGNAATLPVGLSSLGWWSKQLSTSKEKLAQYRAEAIKNLGHKMYDPSAGFYFHLYNPATLQDVYKLLQSLASVEKVYFMPKPVASPVPDYQPEQKYITDQAYGINAEVAWTTHSTRGAGIKMCDIEYSYNANHTDLNHVTLLGGTPTDPFQDNNHGTACMGEVGARDNGWGTTGIASDCQLYFAAADVDTIYDMEVAIIAALDSLHAGDVILLEQQIEGPNANGSSSTTQVGYVPVEWYEPYYNAIRLAIGQGITVVEAAGNGTQNLDDPIYVIDNGGHYPFLIQNNSGAIIVGAGAVGVAAGGTDVARSKLYYSNYGSRVDVQGNGEAVTTTGYGFLYNLEGNNKLYTKQFGGTSSASPIVTGAAVLLQSALKAQIGHTISPVMVRAYLKNTGKPQTSSTSYPSAIFPIGPLPDIDAAITQALATAGLPAIAQSKWVSIYPNPATQCINIHLDNSSTHTTLSVYNALGSKLSEQEITSSDYTADLTNNTSGMYLVIVRDGEKMYTEKVMVEK